MIKELLSGLFYEICQRLGPKPSQDEPQIPSTSGQRPQASGIQISVKLTIGPQRFRSGAV
jgi:hypothetical protein